MKIELDHELAAKLKRMTDLHAINEKEDPAGDAPDSDNYKEYRALQDELVPVFMPLLKRLVKADLLTIAVQDKKGEFMPHKEQAWFGVSSVWDNGNIFLSSGDYRGGSIDRDKPGREKELHTWNPADGDRGLPKRKITTRTNGYFRKAYLAGGPGWDDAETKAGDVLVVNVDSIKHPDTEQDGLLYEYLFDNYKPFALPKYHADQGCTTTTVKLDGGNSAAWSIEVRLTANNKQANGVDSLINLILSYHAKEIKRLHGEYAKEQQEGDE